MLFITCMLEILCTCKSAVHSMSRSLGGDAGVI
jgi:hypothetical protein